MQAEAVQERVLSVVSDMAPFRDARVRPESLLREELGYDSLSLLELAAALEDEFRIPASAELDAEVADTARQVAGIVLAKINALAG